MDFRYFYGMKKRIAMLWVVSMLLQSCAIYHQNSITPEQAANTHHRIIMDKSDNTVLRLHRVEFRDGHYVGIRHGETVDLSAAVGLRPINRAATTIANVSLITAGVAMIVGSILVGKTLSGIGRIGEPGS
jgi:hypothetical protein